MDAASYHPRRSGVRPYSWTANDPRYLTRTFQFQSAVRDIRNDLVRNLRSVTVLARGSVNSGRISRSFLPNVPGTTQAHLPQYALGRPLRIGNAWVGIQALLRRCSATPRVSLRPVACGIGRRNSAARLGARPDHASRHQRNRDHTAVSFAKQRDETRRTAAQHRSRPADNECCGRPRAGDRGPGRACTTGGGATSPARCQHGA
jgi:hypothetical protein